MKAFGWIGISASVLLYAACAVRGAGSGGDASVPLGSGGASGGGGNPGPIGSGGSGSGGAPGVIDTGAAAGSGGAPTPLRKVPARPAR